MANLPKSLTLEQLMTQWASILNPFLSRRSLSSIILPGISLKSGANVVNHLLGRKLTGWRVVRLRASATVYDTQDANPTPSLTLTLTASADVVVDLEVF